MPAHRRVFGYARVSSAEQALGTSLQDQQDAILRYAKGRGMTVARMYVEAESAVYEKAERREQVQALMAEVRSGDLVLVDKIDRWSRDPEFSYGSIRQILSRGAAFYAIGDDCDPSTPQGDSMLGLRVFFAREEHKRIRLRMVGTRKLLRDRGYYAEGLPPWGYRRQAKKGLDRNLLVVCEPEAEAVRRAFRLCIDGSSLVEIANATGQKRDRVYDAMRNRVYLGEVRDASGHWIRGQHPAIIDARTFAAAGAALERRRNGARVARPDSETATWWLRDLARCALCGAKMSAAYGGTTISGVDPYRRYYYKCFRRCTSRYIAVRLVEEQAEPMVVARLVELREELASAAPPAPPTVDLKALEAKRDRIQRRRERYLDSYADGDMTREELRKALSRLDDERTRLDAIETAPPPVSPEASLAVLRQVGAMRRAWAKATPQDRRRIVGALATSVLLAPDVPPRFEWVATEDLARREV